VSVQSTPIGLVTAVTEPRGRGRWTWLGGQWAGVLAAAVLIGFAVLAVAAPLIAPYDPLAMAPIHAFAPPSHAHPFGTDEFGRDLLSRVIFGTRISVGSAAIVVLVAGTIGVSLGVLAGYHEGAVDSIIMRVIDTILAFPAMLLAMGLIAILGQGSGNAIIAAVVISIPAFARLTRATTLQLKALAYVEAVHALGASEIRVMGRTILPNCLPPVLVQAAVNATWAVLLEASLSFLGLGTAPPTPSWGQMLNTSRDYLYRAPWYGLFPGAFLTVLVLALNTLADALQRVLSRGRIR
jgi:peptide/nickel transport system permease protein